MRIVKMINDTQNKDERLTDNSAISVLKCNLEVTNWYSAYLKNECE